MVFFEFASAGRLAQNAVLTGNILLNGKKRRLGHGIVVSISVEIINQI